MDVKKVFCGRMMWKHPPKRINAVMGYRTKRSMKNMDTWKFAHEHCGKLWWRAGWLMLILSVIVQLSFYGRSESAVGTMGGVLCAVQCIVLIASIIPTEKALKQNFDDEEMKKR